MAKTRSVGELVIDITADIRDLRAQMSSVQAALKEAGDGANLFDRIWNGVWERVGHAVTDLGVGAVRAGVSAITGAFKAGINQISKGTLDAAKFQTRLSEIATLGVGDMESLRAGILDVSSSLGQDLQNSVKGVYDAISSGIPQENVIDFLEVSGKAAIAGVTDVATAVDGLTTVINSYGLKASDATRLSDIFFQTVNLGKVTFPELAKAIGDVLPTASILGVSFDEVGAALAVMTAKGINVNEAVTALNQLLNQAISPAEQVADQMGGIVAAAGGLQNLDLGRFVKEIGKLDVPAMSKLLSDVRSLKAALALTGEEGQGISLTEALAKVGSSAGSTEKAFEQFRGNMENNLNILKQTLSNLRTEITSPIAEAIGKNLQVINENFGEGLKGLGTGLKTALADAFNTGFDRQAAIDMAMGFGIQLTNAWDITNDDLVRMLSEKMGVTFEEMTAMLGGGLRDGKIHESIMSFTAGWAETLGNELSLSIQDLQTGKFSFSEIISMYVDYAGRSMPAIMEQFSQTHFAQSMRGALEKSKELIKSAISVISGPILEAVIPIAREAAKAAADVFVSTLGSSISTATSNFFGTFASGFFEQFMNHGNTAQGISSYAGVGAWSGFASGGLVGGSGSRDSVAAMLTPGEMIIPKGMVREMAGMMEGGGTTNLGGVNIVINQQPGQSASDMANEVKRALLGLERRGLTSTRALAGAF